MNLHRMKKAATTASITFSAMILKSQLSQAFSTKAPLVQHTLTYSFPYGQMMKNSPSFGISLDSTTDKSCDPFMSTTTALFSSRNQGRGLATQTEGATPTEGGMTLYLKAGPDGESVGDCPFAHYIRIVLNEKKLPYTTRPCVQETKPAWLVDFYEGKMPALRHRSECYTESDVIAEYLEFFFEDPSLIPKQKKEYNEAKEYAGSIFPSIAKYLKSTDDGSEEDLMLQDNLRDVLGELESMLTAEGRSGPFLSGNGDMLTLVDCSLAPKLFHMKVGLEHFKNNAIDLQTDYPALASYMDTMFSRESFQESLYPEETVVWGWSNARS